MKIPKPSQADKDYFSSIVPEAAGVELKPMFGNLAAFVNGNMFIGLFGADVGVRLSEEEREELAGVPGAGRFGPPERPMKEYVTLPQRWRDEPASTAEWVDRALAYTGSLPPKTKKSRR